MRMCTGRTALRAAAVGALTLQIASFVLLCALYRRADVRQPQQNDSGAEMTDEDAGLNSSSDISDESMYGKAMVNGDMQWNFEDGTLPALTENELTQLTKRHIGQPARSPPPATGNHCATFVDLVTASESGQQPLPIVDVQPAAWDRCGRPPNALVLLRGGARLCARHRKGDRRYVAGEILAASLAKLLGLAEHVPCSALLVQKPARRTNSGKGRLDADRVPLINRLLSAGGKSMGWNEKTSDNWTAGNDDDSNQSKLILSLTIWIDGLQRVSLPDALVFALKENATMSADDKDTDPLLIQWSDMILFDFISGHYDRLASILDEWEKTGARPKDREFVRNVGLASDRSTLIWYDNEAAMLDGYATMYEPNVMQRRDDLRFRAFHWQCLQSTCFYSHKVFNSLKILASSNDPVETLLDLSLQDQPHFSRLDIRRNAAFQYLAQHFADRLRQAFRHLLDCKTRGYQFL